MFEKPDEKVEFVRIPEALKKAALIESKERIGFDQFADLYRADILSEDSARVEEKKKNFFKFGVTQTHELVNKQLATIFEAIIFDQGESANWFGEKAHLVKTSEFDDYIGGVDLVVEFEDESAGVSRMEAGIDVTFSHDVQKKIDIIKERILRGDLGKVKYFKSKVSNYRGELSKVPQIILGADVDTVRELTNDWVANNVVRLRSHPVQFQFFDEAISQCKYFIDFANQNNVPDAVKAYENILKVLEARYRLKKQRLGEDTQTRDSFMRDLNIFLKSR